MTKFEGKMSMATCGKTMMRNTLMLILDFKDPTMRTLAVSGLDQQNIFPGSNFTSDCSNYIKNPHF